MKKGNLLQPELAEIIAVRQESPSIKSFWLRYKDKKRKFPSFLPGRFMEISVFGHGEIPISIASSFLKKDSLMFSVNNVGNTSNALQHLKKGDLVGLRGPFGNGFPWMRFKKKNILFITGGCGLAGMRSLIETVMLSRGAFKEIFLFYGARNPKEIIYNDDLKAWAKLKGVRILTTVDKAGKSWKGNVGLVTELFKRTDIPHKNTVACFCGPPKMIGFSVEELQKRGLQKSQMFVSLERLMQCGMGKCTHCNVGHQYVCIDGPVFNLSQLEKLPEDD